MEETPKKPEDTLSITFRNGALTKIKKIAAELNIPEDRLTDVLTKGINLIDIAKEGSTVTVKKGNAEYAIDLRLI